MFLVTLAAGIAMSAYAGDELSDLQATLVERTRPVAIVSKIDESPFRENLSFYRYSTGNGQVALAVRRERWAGPQRSVAIAYEADCPALTGVFRDLLRMELPHVRFGGGRAVMGAVGQSYLFWSIGGRNRSGAPSTITISSLGPSPTAAFFETSSLRLTNCWSATGA